MPWVATGVRREVEGEREAVVQGGKWGCFTPSIIEQRPGKFTGGRRGLGEAVVRS